MNLLGGYNFEVDVPDGVECDVWYYDDLVYPFTRLSAAVGAEVIKNEPCTFDDILPGCYDQGARLADMDANHVEASICFPNILPALLRPGVLRARGQGARARCASRSTTTG